jgi:branched-chain amino acid transport system substrate-binding protein
VAGALAGAALGARPLRSLATAATDFRIGVLLPRSGYLAGAGNSCYQGVVLAQRLLPELGMPAFQVLAADSGETAETAAREAERLIDAGVHAIVGCYDSGQGVAVAQLAERRHVPFIVNVGAAPGILQPGYRYVFRNFPEAERIVDDSYRLQAELFEVTGFAPRKVALLHINNGRGIELIRERFPAAHMPYELTDGIAYDPKATDLSREVASARASGADGLWLVSRADDAVRIGLELVRQDWTPGILMSSNAGLHEPWYRQALGSNAEYAVTFAPFYDPSKPLTRRLLALQTQLEPEVPLGTLQTYTFEAMLIAVDAYRRARSVDPERLMRALHETRIADHVTPGALIRFDARGENTALGLVALQNLSGAGRVVCPRGLAEAKPRLPMPAWSARA